MRRTALIAAGLLTLAAILALAPDFQDMLARNAMALQREAQDALGAVLRALRNGQPGAISGFLILCLAHGFLHALGPGHGKAVIAAYAAATPASIRWLIGIAAASSAGQAAVAVLLVQAGILLLGGARDRVEGLARMIEPMSFALIALLGLMLALRGLRALPSTAGHADHHHRQECGCGHSHGPAPEAAMAAGNLRTAAALAFGVALRPCTSALFLLILTWRLDLNLLGIIGAFTMGLGTMMVTISAALLAVLLRRGVIHHLPRGQGAAKALAGIELGLGTLIFIIAGMTLLRLI